MTIFVPTAQQRADILESFALVGPAKPVGYLPLPTVVKILHLSVPVVEHDYTSGNRRVMALGPEECCIKGGAVYVFDQQALASLLSVSSALLISLGWPTDSEAFVRRIAAEWLTDDHPLIGLVRQAFGETHSA